MLHMLAPVIERRFQLCHRRGNPPPELLDKRLMRELHARFDHTQSRLHAGALDLWRAVPAQIASPTARDTATVDPPSPTPLTPTPALSAAPRRAAMAPDIRPCKS